MFNVSIGDYDILCAPDELPAACVSYQENAALSDELALHDLEAGRPCFFALARSGEPWPFLVVAQRYEPAGYGFYPGALIVPETNRLFLGAGQRLLIYDIAKPAALWQDSALVGFHGWARHGDVVLMSAELELAAWDLEGRKLWSKFVEPPWTYEVIDGRVRLDVMGVKSEFPARTGPDSDTAGTP